MLGGIFGLRGGRGKTYEFPTPRPEFWTVFPAPSTMPPAKEPAAATPDWMPREMKLSLGAMVGGGFYYGLVWVRYGFVWGW